MKTLSNSYFQSNKIQKKFKTIICNICKIWSEVNVPNAATFDNCKYMTTKLPNNPLQN